MQELEALYWRFDNYSNIAIASFFGILAGTIAFVAILPLETLANPTILTYLSALGILLIVSVSIEVSFVVAFAKTSQAVGKCQNCNHRLKSHENKKGETHRCTRSNWRFQRCTCEHFVRAV